MLPEFLRRVGAVLDAARRHCSEIVLVDDGSRDRTWEVMTEPRRPPIRGSSPCG